uniref:Uncharacterized protein n=1 Tax=viral metagenome TaxID=1070528 RepID=A0A6H1ZMD9_9ZZZZ
MTSWNEFLRTDDFRAYRKKQIEAVAANLKKTAFQTVSNGRVDVSEIKGKLEMINLFLRLPEILTNDTKTKEILAVQLDEDVNHIAQFLIRQSLAEEK